jgi:hypothetical protein
MTLSRSLQNVRRSLNAKTFRTTHDRFQSAFRASTGAHCKPRSRQVRELVQLAMRRSFCREEYFAYRFYERDKSYAEMFRFMPRIAMREALQPGVNDRQWVPILDNKWVFHQHYAPLGVPLPQLYGYFHTEHGLTRHGLPLRSVQDVLRLLREIRPQSLVIKPVGGLQGRSVLVFTSVTHDGDQVEARTIDGRLMSFQDIMAHMTAEHGIRYEPQIGYVVEGGGYLLEEKLDQHPFFAHLNPYTINTIRVVTFVESSGEAPIDFAALRLGRRGSTADNWAQGGISVAIDPVTGRLGRGFTKPKHGGEWLEVHPDTQVRFTDMVVPMWREILDVCRRAARVTPHVRSVGWDVLVTPSGPKLIEGNSNWDLMMVQVHSNGYLQPDVRERYARYGVRFPEWPPRVDLRGPLMLIRFSNT